MLDTNTEIIFNQQVSKVKQLADAINHIISAKSLKPGDPLPSINCISREYDVSRDTVFKAFNDLKARGVVDSAPTKGYYVANAEVNVFLLLDIYSPFKYELHRALTRKLPMNYKIDLYFHQYSEERFNKLITDSLGRYNSYLVMNYRNDVYSEILDKLDTNKTMLLDFGKFEKEKFAYVCQGFDTTLYDCLSEGKELLAKYKKIVFVYPDVTEHPASCIPYFEKFCNDFGFPYVFRKEVHEEDVVPGNAFLIVKHMDLVEMVKLVRARNLELGRDIGAAVFNDEPMFEILDQGITAISTDFRMMGNVAADFIRSHKKIQTYIPTRLIVRGSL